MTDGSSMESDTVIPREKIDMTDRQRWSAQRAKGEYLDFYYFPFHNYFGFVVLVRISVDILEKTRIIVFVNL